MVQTKLCTQKRHDLRDKCLLRHKNMEMIINTRTRNLDFTKILSQDVLNLLQIRPLAEHLQKTPLAPVS